jgi:hypothetical protein
VSAPSLDLADPVAGVPARGFEPAVVVLAVGGRAVCAGALVASDVVLTARHCVVALPGPLACPSLSAPAVPAGSPSAPPVPPWAVTVFTGDDAANSVERAHARSFLLPASDDLCTADVALILLDEAIDDVAPLAVRSTGVATGDRVRTVSLGALPREGSPSSGGGFLKVLRDHVLVTTTSSVAFEVREDPGWLAGGPALEEASGEVLGVASQMPPAGGGAGTGYMRADAFLPLLQSALADSAFGSQGPRTGLLKSLKGPADLGDNCVRGADCAAGACVTLDASRYCSRSCDAHDRCPAHFRCEASDASVLVCVRSRGGL